MNTKPPLTAWLPTVPVLVLLGCCAGCDSHTKPLKSASESERAVSGDPPPEIAAPAPYAPRPAGTITYANEISAIVIEKCAPCHHAGGIGPFPLMTEADVRKRAEQIVDVTQRRIMPPWAPLPGYCEFEQDLSLSTEEIGSIAQWVDEGMAAGDAALVRAPPQFSSGWQHGEPDLVVSMPEAFVVPAGTRDIFRKFVLRVPIEETKYVRFYDFDPGNRSAVHHMRLRVDSSSMSRSQDQLDPQPGYDVTEVAGDVEPDGFCLIWAPGFQAVPKRSDVAWTLQKGTDLVLELHLKGTGKPETIRSSIALYFSPDPPRERLHLTELECQTIDLPPGRKDVTYHDQYVLPVNVRILSVFPHAHYLATDLSSYAVLPDGEKIWLMRIGDWDFNWQREYTYSEPISLPSGTALHMRVVYDNSAENPRNPRHPPERVLIGPGSYDEMAEMIFQIQTVRPADGALLDMDFAQKYNRSLVEKQYFLIERGHNLDEAHYNLGCLFALAGDIPQAMQHYQEATRFNPDNYFAVNNLGSVYRRLGRPEDARQQYARAREINPLDPRPVYNLGLIDLDQQQFDQAEQFFREALQIMPEFAEAEANLGLIAAHQNRVDDAIAHFERALQSNPDLEGARPTLQQLRQRLQGQP